MFYSAIIFWIMSLVSWIVLQFFARSYRISDLPFWDWLLPADFFLLIEVINEYLSFNFQYIVITIWLALWLLIMLYLLIRSDDRHSLKACWFYFINLSGVLLLLELFGVIIYIFLSKR